MEYWSPQDAMKAYLFTLHLCRLHGNGHMLHGGKAMVEPKCMEFISAMAAGRRAKLMVEITSASPKGAGVTPIALALAVAAKQTGGRLICINLLDHHQQDAETNNNTNNKAKLAADFQDHGLEDFVEFVCGNYPFEVTRQYKNIDFLVIDGSKLLFGDDHVLKFVKTISVNPSGSVIVGHGIEDYKTYRGSIAQVFKGSKGFHESVTLPIGEGMEMTKIRRCKRFHVTFEN